MQTDWPSQTKIHQISKIKPMNIPTFKPNKLDKFQVENIDHLNVEDKVAHVEEEVAQVEDKVAHVEEEVVPVQEEVVQVQEKLKRSIDMPEKTETTTEHGTDSTMKGMGDSVRQGKKNANTVKTQRIFSRRVG